MAPELPFDAEREDAELREYLGGSYDRSKLEQYQQTLDAEFGSCGDEQRFYRTSEGYLYNLTAFAMTATKLPYLRELTRHVAPGARILDYGCGIGSDGLLLLDAGYRVEFADFANPSTEYLRWRLERRGHSAAVHDIDREVPGGFDAAFAFDVIEHVEDPYAFLGEMESRAALVEVNFLEFDEHEQDLHHELPIRDLVRRAAALDLRYYRVFYGGSHLVVYGSERAGLARRVSGSVRHALGAARARL